MMNAAISFALATGLVLCCLPAGAQEQWAHPECRYRTEITGPEPARDAAQKLAEVAADFSAILREAGIEGAFDPASLRLVERGWDLPFAFRTEYDPRREVSYLA
ncbi:MAG: hypothetical protein HPY44_09780 [Armatimonadetes bacterium]|nr:hypothetical protein [Armatimonadota bacterium]